MIDVEKVNNIVSDLDTIIDAIQDYLYNRGIDPIVDIKLMIPLHNQSEKLNRYDIPKRVRRRNRHKQALMQNDD